MTTNLLAILTVSLVTNTTMLYQTGPTKQVPVQPQPWVPYAGNLLPNPTYIDGMYVNWGWRTEPDNGCQQVWHEKVEAVQTAEVDTPIGKHSFEWSRLLISETNYTLTLKITPGTAEKREWERGSGPPPLTNVGSILIRDLTNAFVTNTSIILKPCSKEASE